MSQENSIQLKKTVRIQMHVVNNMFMIFVSNFRAISFSAKWVNRLTPGALVASRRLVLRGTSLMS